jgi:hypothetical protein
MFKSVHQINQSIAQISQMFKSIKCSNQSNVQINQMFKSVNQMFKSINCSYQSIKYSNQSIALINQSNVQINQSNVQINQSASIVVQVQVAAASAWLADLLRERKDAGGYSLYLSLIQQCTVCCNLFGKDDILYSFSLKSLDVCVLS